MPAVRAERLCPNAIFVAPDFIRYRDVSRSVREIFKRHTDLIEPLSVDEAYLDVTENKTGLATATLVARTIREQIRQELNLTASAGVAPNKFLAKLASDWRKPDGLFVVQPEEVDAFLLPLPVGRLPGVGKVTGEKLAKLGIETVAALRKLDLPALEREFGRYGLRLHEFARGIDDSPVIPDRLTQSISAEDTFEHDVPLSETEGWLAAHPHKEAIVKRYLPRQRHWRERSSLSWQKKTILIRMRRKRHIRKRKRRWRSRFASGNSEWEPWLLCFGPQAQNASSTWGVAKGNSCVLYWKRRH
jgi:nucleotidyltransferase/DNA polymerase involved in DNA repair